MAAVFRVVEDAGGSELAACQSVFGFTAATPSLPLAARLKVLSMLAPVTGVRISAVPRSAPKITTSSKSSSSSSASRPTSAGSSSSARRLSLTSTSSSTASAATRTGTSLPATSSNSNNSSTEALSLLAPNSSYRFPTASYDPSTSLAKHPGLVELLTRPQYEVVLAVDETASALKKALTGVEGIGKEEAHFVVEELRRRMGEERRKQKEWEGSWASVVTPAVERIKQEVEGRAAQRTAEQKASLSGSGRTGRPF